MKKVALILLAIGIVVSSCKKETPQPNVPVAPLQDTTLPDTTGNGGGSGTGGTGNGGGTTTDSLIIQFSLAIVGTDVSKNIDSIIFINKTNNDRFNMLDSTMTLIDPYAQWQSDNITQSQIHYTVYGHKINVNDSCAVEVYFNSTNTDIKTCYVQLGVGPGVTTDFTTITKNMYKMNTISPYTIYTKLGVYQK